jgi:nitroreductase
MRARKQDIAKRRYKLGVRTVDVYDAIVTRRTIRKFLQRPIERETLLRLLNAARLAPSASNLQPCEYILVTDKRLLEEVFSTLRWAAYIAPRGTPKEDERPVAYVVVLINTKKRAEGGEVDCAAAIENLILAAWGEGIGACWMGSVDRARIKEVLGIPDHCKVDSVIALGYKAEQPVVEDLRDGDVRYWKDEKGTLHVPKRRLEDIAFSNRYGDKLSSC